MCNTYVVRPKRGAQALAQRISEETAKLIVLLTIPSVGTLELGQLVKNCMTA